MVKSLPDWQETQETKRHCLILGLGRSPGEGYGNPVQYFLPGKFHRQRSLAGYSPWGHKELDMTQMSVICQIKKKKSFQDYSIIL